MWGDSILGVGGTNPWAEIHDSMKEENELNMSIHGFLPRDCGPLLQVPAAMMTCCHDDLLP